MEPVFDIEPAHGSATRHVSMRALPSDGTAAEGLADRLSAVERRFEGAPCFRLRCRRACDGAVR